MSTVKDDHGFVLLQTDRDDPTRLELLVTSRRADASSAFARFRRLQETDISLDGVELAPVANGRVSHGVV